jgi:MFS family permease
MVSQWIFTWISVTGALSIAPMFPLLGQAFHLNNSQLGFLTGITVITLGFANFIIVPLSNIYGRRAVSLVFSVLIMLTCIWEALASSHRSLLAARAVTGLVCATSESIPVQMIADVFFLHERGLWTGGSPLSCHDSWRILTDILQVFILLVTSLGRFWVQ